MEISEIGVRIHVRDEPHDGAARGADAGTDDGQATPRQDEIVRACVRLVLQALRDQGAR
ncbi:hypothetical protein FHW83_004233 [Duganella sp. SG902]|uniref:DUF5908 family protein n=1 Tax=Duganella sp. SG902 TaxID=2587016 RepID=UPI00159E79CB|nr:hypothetical protein [Duganella sp. SG902]